MIIVQPAGGLGNQFGQYVAARLLAYRLNTELKLDIRNFNTAPEFNKRSHAAYRLGDFNIMENFATPEEIKHVKRNGVVVENPLPELQDLQGDIYMQGQWPRDERYFAEIIDIVRKEFTLKKPFSPIAETWRKKILSAECSVAMHFRHGDFAYNPNLISNDIHKSPWFNILPLNYYYTCLDILKQRYDKLTAFVFSDNLTWVKENLRADVPTEFVEGCETAGEDFILMSLCKHMIKPSSSFSEYAAALNANPDKKIFTPRASTAEGVQQFVDSLTADKKNAILNADGWISVPFDYYNQPEITIQPIFSLLLVVNDDAANLPATLESLLGQDYKYYEVIIIDNATTDGSDKICRQAVKDKANVTYKRLDKKVGNGTAWNKAFNVVAQGKYVLFLKVGDRFLSNSLTSLYLINEYRQADIIHMVSWLEENESGDKKFSAQQDERFKQAKKPVIMSKNGIDAAKLLRKRQINSFLGTKLYNREFLTEHKIKFDEQLDDDAAEFVFQKETFSKTKYLMYSRETFYIAPKLNR